jgi:hypothetical protein
MISGFVAAVGIAIAVGRLSQEFGRVYYARDNSMGATETTTRLELDYLAREVLRAFMQGEPMPLRARTKSASE